MCTNIDCLHFLFFSVAICVCFPILDQAYSFQQLTGQMFCCQKSGCVFKKLLPIISDFSFTYLLNFDTVRHDSGFSFAFIWISLLCTQQETQTPPLQTSPEKDAHQLRIRVPTSLPLMFMLVLGETMVGPLFGSGRMALASCKSK
jgi:hypothetical protein